MASGSVTTVAAVQSAMRRSEKPFIPVSPDFSRHQ